VLPPRIRTYIAVEAKQFDNLAMVALLVTVCMTKSLYDNRINYASCRAGYPVKIPCLKYHRFNICDVNICFICQTRLKYNVITAKKPCLRIPCIITGIYYKNGHSTVQLNLRYLDYYMSTVI